MTISTAYNSVYYQNNKFTFLDHKDFKYTKMGWTPAHTDNAYRYTSPDGKLTHGWYKDNLMFFSIENH